MSDEPIDTPEARFSQNVSELVESIKGVPAAIRGAVADAAKPLTPEPAPQSQLTEERLNEVAQEYGIGAAMKILAVEGMVPMQMQNYNLLAKRNLRDVEKDSELGGWAKEHRAEIDAKVKADGISAQYLAEHGYEGVVRSLRDLDPTVREAEIKAEVDRQLAERVAAGGYVPTPIRTPPPVGRPGAPPALGSPPVNLTSQQTRDEAIAAVEMSAQDVDFQKRYFRLTPEQAKRQRYEREALEKKHGEHGLKALGGYPICTLTDLGIPESE